MNFLDGALNNGRIEIGAGKLGVPKLICGGIVKIVLGIRPQDLQIVPTAGSDTLPGRVSLIELLGSEKLVEVELETARVNVQVRADFEISEKTSTHVRFDPLRLHVFDAETGQAIRAY
jgi:ABC-type sugar transport system ATPase subunit